MKTVPEIFAEHFTNNTSRDKRSNVYQYGVLDALNLKCHGRKAGVKYEAGTVEFDAYFAGHNEGKLIYQMEKDKEQGR